MLCFISDIMSNMMNTFFTLLCIDWTIHTRGIMSNSDHNMAKCFVICFKDAMHNDYFFIQIYYEMNQLSIAMK